MNMEEIINKLVEEIMKDKELTSNPSDEMLSEIKTIATRAITNAKNEAHLYFKSIGMNNDLKDITELFDGYSEMNSIGESDRTDTSLLLSILHLTRNSNVLNIPIESKMGREFFIAYNGIYSVDWTKSIEYGKRASIVYNYDNLVHVRDL